jgi:glycosyltransferase involved in cell wall biosynthesis
MESIPTIAADRQHHLLHVMPSFGFGGAQVRVIQLMSYFGDAFRHSVIALDGCFDACRRVSSTVRVDRISSERTANPWTMYKRLGEHIRRSQPDAVLTYNWGSIDAVLAAAHLQLPVIHTEDGFGADEATNQKLRRVIFRRIVLRRAHAVIAPSASLVSVMREVWRLPSRTIQYIPNGVDTQFFRPVATDLARSNVRVGTAASLRPEKCIDRLLVEFARFSRSTPATLRIAGDGPERPELETLARRLGIAERVQFLGHIDDLREFYRDLDIFAMTSCTEQMPLVVLEAMACGLAIVSTDVGDVRAMVSASNAPFVVGPESFAGALAELSSDAALRARVGRANRLQCEEVFPMHKMFDSYAKLYGAVLAA